MAWIDHRASYLTQLLVADVANTTSTNQDRTAKKCFKRRCFVSVFFVGSSAAFLGGAPYLIHFFGRLTGLYLTSTADFGVQEYQKIVGLQCGVSTAGKDSLEEMLVQGTICQEENNKKIKRKELQKARIGGSGKIYSESGELLPLGLHDVSLLATWDLEHLGRQDLRHSR